MQNSQNNTFLNKASNSPLNSASIKPELKKTFLKKKGEKPTFAQDTNHSMSISNLYGFLRLLNHVIGTLYYGTVEPNPIIAGLVSTNLPAFVIIKLTVTVCVGLIFVLVDKKILESADKDCESFKTANKILKMAYIGIILFLVIVVANNIFVLIKVLL